MKSTFSGLQFCRLAAVALQMYEIAQNSKKIQVQGHPKSPTLVPIESSNFGRISHRFWDIAAQS